MRNVPTGPHAGQVADPSAVPLDFADPSALRAWLARVEAVADDALSAGEDQIRSPAERDLGRRQAGRLLAEARSSLARLLDVARRGLPSA